MLLWCRCTHAVVLLYFCCGAVAMLCGCGLPEASGVASFSTSASVSSPSKAPARSPPSPRSARDEPAFASLTQTPTDGPARFAARAGTAEVLRIEDSPQPENPRFSRLSFASLTRRSLSNISALSTRPAPIGVAQTTTLDAGRQPASPEDTLTARGSTARSPRSSTAHCVRVTATGRPLCPTRGGRCHRAVPGGCVTERVQ
jgi:hypothetical protein